MAKQTKKTKTKKRSKYGTTDVKRLIFRGTELDVDGYVVEDGAGTNQRYVDQQGVTAKERAAFHNFMWRVRKARGLVPKVGGPVRELGPQGREEAALTHARAMGELKGQLKIIDELLPKFYVLIGQETVERGTMARSGAQALAMLAQQVLDRRSAIYQEYNNKDR